MSVLVLLSLTYPTFKSTHLLSNTLLDRFTHIFKRVDAVGQFMNCPYPEFQALSLKFYEQIARTKA